MSSTDHAASSHPNGEDVHGLYAHLCDTQRKSSVSTDSTSQLKEVNEAFIAGIGNLSEDGRTITQVRAAQERAAALEAEVAALRAERTQLKGRPSSGRSSIISVSRPQDTATFVAFGKELAEFHEHLMLCKTVFDGVLTKSAEDVRDERVSQQDQRFTEPRAWAAKKEVLTRSLESLRAKTHSLRLSSSYLSDDEVLFHEVMELGSDAADHVRRGEDLRADRDEKLRVFYTECGKLTGWCRQQLTNLEAMQEPDHVQEYCATLAENYPTMSSNFAVLLESVRDLVRANLIPVHRALLEAEEVWLYLQVSVLERLSRTLFEIHPQSPLEVEVAKYADYPAHVGRFLHTLSRFLEAHRGDGDGDGGALSSQELDRLHASSEAVQLSLAGEMAELPEEVQQFAHRVRAVRQGYQCFREALLSRLTFISPAANVVMESRQRQEEFEECVRELKGWATDASRGESWRDIYSKISEIKRLIQSEQDAVANKRERTMGSTGVLTPRSARVSHRL